jgi:5-methylcytosine-specific restriction endonuclease McrA
MRGDFRHNRPRLRLTAKEYNLIRKQVLRRDAWRCQDCGSAGDLHVHHLEKRSKLGDDASDNLITLCATCHRRRHYSN